MNKTYTVPMTRQIDPNTGTVTITFQTLTITPIKRKSRKVVGK